MPPKAPAEGGAAVWLEGRSSAEEEESEGEGAQKKEALKSAKRAFRCLVSSSRSRRMFAGLMSAWTTPLACMNASPDINCGASVMNRFNVSAGDRGREELIRSSRVPALQAWKIKALDRMERP